MPPIRYRSTRAAAPLVSFRHALLEGLAPDGGLFVPTAFPRLEPSDWAGAAAFDDLAVKVLGRWLEDELPPDALEAIVRDALNFPVPVAPLSGGAWDGVSVLELYHGPTLSFKDFGARVMARLMSHFLAEEGRELTILVATSGDTGSAVADGFAGQQSIRVVLLYPKGQVSPVQERQLIVRREGVQALAVEGTFDDCQRMVKEAFMDPELAGAALSSANSINIGRLLPQMLYYLWALRGREDAVFCTPSGNLGNLTGGMLARLSGAPIRRFVAAHNANDFFPRHLSEGLDAFAPSVGTLSNAMDVGAPSNFERLRALMDPAALRDAVWGASVTDAETVATLQRVYAETGYLADPHTCVGLEAAQRYRQADPGREVVVLSTAHPAKFPETIAQALSQAPEAPPRLAALWNAPTRVQTIAPRLAALRERLAEPAPAP